MKNLQFNSNAKRFHPFHPAVYIPPTKNNFSGRIKLPHNYEPRGYQIPVLRAIDQGWKRAVCVWHRRAGKDFTFLNLVAKKMYKRVGTYYYFFPTYNQGRKILWDGMDREGIPFLSHIPEVLRANTNNQEMKIKLKNGSLFQVIGSENINSIVGTNPVGCVFSEYSLQDPAGWDFIRPILAENDGWAIFCFTPRGENHGYAIYKLAQDNPAEWFSQILTVDDTDCIPRNILETERAEIKKLHGDDALFQQEYYCSFTVPLQGSYYASQIQDAYKEKRIDIFPYDKSLPVNSYWDIGVGDATAIWFGQQQNKKIYLIDYYENTGEGLQHYIEILQSKKYIYSKHYAPHDIENREWGSGKSRKETAQSLGISFTTIPKLSVDDGIHAVRMIFNRCFFDSKKCERGLNALKNYHKEWNDERKIYNDIPFHDWSSHGSDAFRTLAVGYTEEVELEDDGQFQYEHKRKGY